MKEHVNDFFVKQAKKEGYRSRAAYKLLEIDERDRILKPGMIVVDLGAAPGSWSQVVYQKLGNNGKIVALDILEMVPLPNVTFIQGDFSEDQALNALRHCLAGQRVNLVISDMAPNMSGIAVSDQAKSMYLAELALAFAVEQLNSGGNFLVKVFQGRDFDSFLREMRVHFHNVVTRKPKASRDRSSELYLLGFGKKDGRDS